MLVDEVYIQRSGVNHPITSSALIPYNFLPQHSSSHSPTTLTSSYNANFVAAVPIVSAPSNIPAIPSSNANMDSSTTLDSSNRAYVCNNY